MKGKTINTDISIVKILQNIYLSLNIVDYEKIEKLEANLDLT